MLTETEIIKMLSGSMIGDYPAVLSEVSAREYAHSLFKKMFDVDDNGKVNSILFYQAINMNPSALAESQTEKLDAGLIKLNRLKDTIIPEKVGTKLPLFLNVETLPDLLPEQRENIKKDRDRLADIFRQLINVPTILSVGLIG